VRKAALETHRRTWMGRPTLNQCTVPRTLHLLMFRQRNRDKSSPVASYQHFTCAPIIRSPPYVNLHFLRCCSCDKPFTPFWVYYDTIWAYIKGVLTHLKRVLYTYFGVH